MFHFKEKGVEEVVDGVVVSIGRWVLFRLELRGFKFDGFFSKCNACIRVSSVMRVLFLQN